MPSKNNPPLYLIRNARLPDAPQISSLINTFSREGIMLSKTTENIIEDIRNFFVADLKGQIIGCCAVSFFTEELAEIRSVAIDETFKGKGIGSDLIKKAEDVLKEEGIKYAFVLTLTELFFTKLGYLKVDKSKYPQKIWRDCLSCPKIMQCDEIAMEKKL